MKKKDLKVGEFYAHKYSNRPYRLASMQPWQENRKMWSNTVLAYHPAPPGAPMRNGHSYGDLGTVGRVVLVGPTQVDLEEVEIPGFLEKKVTDDQDKTRLNEKFMAWRNGLPWGVKAELINTALLVGPYEEVEERRQAENERRFQLDQRAQKINQEWSARLERVQAALQERGQSVMEVGFAETFPEERNRTDRRLATVQMSIEAMEDLLGLDSQG